MFGLGRKKEHPALQAITPARTKWNRVVAFSPYWSNQEDTSRLTDELCGEGEVQLVPAPMATGDRVYLGVDDDEYITEHRVVDESSRRFRHAKLYVAFGSYGKNKRARITLGSANMTTAALDNRTPKAPGNVEALLSFNVTPRNANKFLPNLERQDRELQVATEGVSDESEFVPFAIYVIYDWAKRHYIISLECDKFASDLRLSVIGSITEQALKEGRQTIPAQLGPQRSTEYRLNYLYSPAKGEAERRTAVGLITELSLDESDHQYSPTLTLEEFFPSWLDPNAEVTSSQGDIETLPDEENEEAALDLSSAEKAPIDQLDATNLFEIYRALRSLETLRLQPALEETDEGLLFDLLVAHPNSIAAFVKLLERQTTNPGVKLALLLESSRLFNTYGKKLPDPTHRGRVVKRHIAKSLAAARKEVLAELPDPDTGTKKEMLKWFESRLGEAWT